MGTSRGQARPLSSCEVAEYSTQSESQYCVVSISQEDFRFDLRLAGRPKTARGLHSQKGARHLPRLNSERLVARLLQKRARAELKIPIQPQWCTRLHLRANWLEGEPATSRQRFWGSLWTIYKGVAYRIPLYWRYSADPATAQKAGNKAGNVAVLPAHLLARLDFRGVPAGIGQWWACKM